MVNTQAALSPKELQIEEIKAQIAALREKDFQILKKAEKIAAENKIEFVPKTPNPKQKLILDAWLDPKWKVFTYTGGNRTAKTTTWVWIALSMLAGHYLWNPDIKLTFPHKMPRRIRVVGQDWEKHIKTVVIPKLKEWWPKSRRVETKKNNVGVESFWIDSKTHSTLEIMSNQQESDLFEGWDGDAIFYDEPPKRDIRIACARGLVDRKGREYFGMTLLKEPWINKEVLKATNDDGTPDMTVFNVHAVTWDNVSLCLECGGYIHHFEDDGLTGVCVKCGPTKKFQRYGLDLEGVQDLERKLTEKEKQARLYGVPSYMADIIWPIDRRLHIKKPFTVPLDWLVEVQIDFHPAKPWAINFLATDPRNFHWVVDEIWEHGNPKAIAERIIRKILDNHYRCVSIEVDPLAKGDSNNDETVFETMSRVFMSYGFVLRPATKDKDNGIAIIKDWLMTENEMPALFIFENCKKTIEQVENWCIDPDTLKPSKEEDDMCECLYRHGLHNRQWYEPDEDDETYEPRTYAGRSRITGY